MSRDALAPSGRPLVLFTLLFGLAWPATAATDARVSEAYGKLPLHFEANRGQTHGDVRFLSRGAGYSLYLTAGEAVLVLSSPGAETQAAPVALRMALVGANRKPPVRGLDELPGKANYFIGKDRSKWLTNVPTHAKVHYQNVYPGIDLVYYGNQQQLEYDFVVASGADPHKIVLGFKGAERLEIDAEGALVLHTAGGAIHQKKPVIYQEIDGVRKQIEGGYVLKGSRRIGFKIATYDRGRPLVIDPVVLFYSTYLGGSGPDLGYGIAVDTDGHAYVTGETRSIDFPTTVGAFQPIHGGSTYDVFVTKLNPQGTMLVYSTYLGGIDNDKGRAIAVDSDANAYVTGSTWSNNFPTSMGAFQPSFGAAGAFVTKLDPTGSALVYSTYLSGTGSSGIAVDATGNAYVTGGTSSIDLPTTMGAFQPSYGGGSVDAYVTKFDPAGSALVYSTYLGGSGGELSTGIAVDAAGNAYVTGQTGSIDFPTTAGAFQPVQPTNESPSSAGSDAFVMKLNPSGTGLVYSTYLGGRSTDVGHGIAVDTDGNAYVTGGTQSIDFPTTVGAFHPISNGSIDTFITKLDPTGSVLGYSTLLGASSQGHGIAVDAAGHAYVTGHTGSTLFPTTPGAFQPSLGGCPSFPFVMCDAFVTKLHATGSSLVYSSYLGGSGEDGGLGIAVGRGGNAYVTGITSSTNFPTTLAFQPVNRGGYYDAFVAKIVDLTPPPDLPR